MVFKKTLISFHVKIWMIVVVSQLELATYLLRWIDTAASYEIIA